MTLTADTQNTDLNLNADDVDANDASRTGTAAGGAQPDDGHVPIDGALPEGGEDDELEFGFGDEVAPASQDGQQGRQNSDADWIKELRRNYTASQRRIRELEAQQQAGAQQQQPVTVPTLGPRPKLADFDFDEAKHEAALDQWLENKRKVDTAQAESERVVQAGRQKVADRETLYKTGSQRIKGFRELEDEVVLALTPEQQGILLMGAKDPALLVAALGRYPNRLKALAEIKDPVQFAFAAGDLQSKLKTNRQEAGKAAPERRVSSSTSVSPGGAERRLEQLRAEAERTGDYTQVVAYKRQMNAQGKRK